MPLHGVLQKKKRARGPLFLSLIGDYFGAAGAAGASAALVSFFDFLDDFDFLVFLAFFSAFGASAAGAEGAGDCAAAWNVTAAKMAAIATEIRCFILVPP